VTAVLHDDVRLAMRDNPARRHLLVSRVLGKHVPARPAAVLDAATAVAHRAAERIRAAGERPEDAFVIGFAETATGLAECVADELAAAHSSQSTRYPPPGVRVDARFEEEHSHATEHSLSRGSLPAADTRMIVLVDDELTSGRTVLNIADALRARCPRAGFVVAVLIDSRPAESRAAFDRRAALLGLEIAVVAGVQLSAEAVRAGIDEMVERVAGAGASASAAAPAGAPTRRPPALRRADAPLRAEVPPGLSPSARSGWSRRRRHQAIDVARTAAGLVVERLAGEPLGDVLVLGTEEFLYLPLKLAEALDARLPETRVWSSSTTRSPGLVCDLPGYGLRSGIRFAVRHAPGEPEARFAYNVATVPDTDARFDLIVLCCDDVTSPSVIEAASDGLLARLEDVAPRVLVVDFAGGAG
jgi:pyrimidine operon attenuation protein/uracil phosphoribosyltransferase